MGGGTLGSTSPDLGCRRVPPQVPPAPTFLRAGADGVHVPEGLHEGGVRLQLPARRGEVLGTRVSRGGHTHACHGGTRRMSVPVRHPPPPQNARNPPLDTYARAGVRMGSPEEQSTAQWCTLARHLARWGSLVHTCSPRGPHARGPCAPALARARAKPRAPLPVPPPPSPGSARRRR